MFEPKPLFRERIEKLLGSEAADFFNYCYKPLPNYIRCNTLKISPAELFERLDKKWAVKQPFPEHQEILKVESKLNGSPLEPGELGRAREHLLGYYYVQGLSSMMPALALEAKANEKVLDLCSSPGSKTTQLASCMQNSGLLVANDVRLDRIIILNSNLERCAVTNAIVTKEDGAELCRKISKLGFKFDRILVDAPCSGEGTIREDLKAFQMWNFKMIENYAKNQKRLAAAALSVLKEQGTLVYSTCTLSPEENEEVVQFLLDHFPVKIEKIELPIKTRPGIKEWKGRKFNKEMERCCRIYPQDNNSEGFFVAKVTKEK